MEEQINQTQTTNPTPTPIGSPEPTAKAATPPTSPKSGSFKSKLPWLLVVLLLVLIVPLAGYVAMNELSKTMTPSPIPSPIPEVACTQEAKICPDGSSVGREGPNCEFSPCPTGNASTSADFKEFLNDLTNAVNKEDLNAIISMQRVDEIECDPTSEGIVQTICEGESKGTKKTGYWYGPTQSEFSIVPKDQYLTYLKEIFNQNGPYTYFDSKQMNNKAIVVYKGRKLENINFDSMIGIYVTNKDSQWQTSYFVYGPLTEDYNPIIDDHFTFN